MTQLLAVIIGAWVLLTVALVLAQRNLIYLPDRHLALTPSDVVVTTVETADGVVHEVWTMPADGVAMARVVVFNGNAGKKGPTHPRSQSRSRWYGGAALRLSGLRRHRGVT